MTSATIEMLEPALRVALVYDDSLDRPGGVAQHVRALRDGLTAMGHEAHLLVGETTSSDELCRSLSRNLSVRFNGNRLSIPVLTSGSRLDWVLENLVPDVLHVQMPYSPVLAGRLIARVPTTTAVVGTAHVYSERVAPALGARMLAAVNSPSAKRFDRVLAVSGAARTFAELHSRARVDALVPNMVDVSAARQSAATGTPADSDLAVAFVGSLVPRKGVDRLLAAWPRVLQRHPQARLRIAGDGPLRASLQRFAGRLGVDASVDFLGVLDESSKYALLGSSRVACFPSTYGESFGIVLLEAMAAGTPVVLGGDNAGYRELLGDHPDALVNPSAVSALAARLETALDEAPHDDLRRRWQQRLVERYDVPTVTSQVVDQYRLALASRRGAASGERVAA